MGVAGTVEDFLRSVGDTLRDTEDLDRMADEGVRVFLAAYRATG